MDDLIQLIPLVEGYGEHKGKDATGYVAKALELYPDSVNAILLFASMNIPGGTNKERMHELLDRAVLLAPGRVDVYSTRGRF